ncbi:unnamed protein product [Clonostachys solani]|uniref:RING-type E3 ubiquitin transferase n=1 Tax=Clonostachys solani TaxID=160281 RepID=A0A9N9Z5H8_9HYPO|nr:unnamed protein product [Clonostachys solani]
MASPAVPSSSSPAHESLADEASNRAFTSHRSAEEQNDEAPCPWRTSLYYDEECSRYFDCPSHGIERRLSVDEQPASLDIEPGNHSGVHINSTETGGARLESSELRPGERSALNSGSHQHQGTTSAAPSRLNMEISGLSSSAPTASLLNVGAEFGEPSGSQPGATYGANASLASQNIHRNNSREDGEGHSDIDRFRGLDLNAALNMPLPETQRGEPSIRLPIQDEEIDAQHGGSESVSSDFALPRWQPDAEVTYCPICQTQFSIFVRKHHCRKCGRVVCNSCSPHRIIIPHQYIVRPPGAEIPILPQTLLTDQLGVGYFDVNGIPGGERVRLCNPCVPDPNIAPPQGLSSSASTPPAANFRGSHSRSRSSIGNAYEAAMSSNSRHGISFNAGQLQDPFSPSLSSRAYRVRSVTLSPGTHSRASNSGRRISHASSIRFPESSLSGATSSNIPHRYSSFGEARVSSRHHRQLPPPPQIAEEDECPVCHLELPSRSLENYESLRESHITSCIQSHSTFGSPRPGEGESHAAPRLTGMYTYPATEKDCVDDAECTICLEEFVVGVPMARLECLCRFHRTCIVAWFVNHPGRCPVHQHDGFGY